MITTQKVIITSLPEKLPDEVRALADAGQPLPPGTQFFEEKLTAGSSLKRLAIGIVLVVIGVLLMLVGVAGFFQMPAVSLYEPLFAGVVFAFAGYFLIASLRVRMRLAREQRNGVDTRCGIFLLGDLLVSRSSSDTTVIPRAFFKGLQGRALRYELEGAPKSFDLPAAIVGRDAREMHAAIAEWAARG